MKTTFVLVASEFGLNPLKSMQVIQNRTGNTVCFTIRCSAKWWQRIYFRVQRMQSVPHSTPCLFCFYLSLKWPQTLTLTCLCIWYICFMLFIWLWWNSYKICRYVDDIFCFFFWSWENCPKLQIVNISQIFRCCDENIESPFYCWPHWPCF